MTACTPGSAPGPTLGNEYGKPLLPYSSVLLLIVYFTLAASSSKRQASVSVLASVRLSVCISRIFLTLIGHGVLNVTHQGTARVADSVHFSPSI